MIAFGLDIGSESIKVSQLTKEKNNFRLQAVGMVKNPFSDLNEANDNDLGLIAQTIKKLKSESGIKTVNVIASLPERYVFSHLLELIKMPQADLEQAIIFESENIIPKPSSEVNLDWQIIENKELEKTGKVPVYLVAAPKLLVEKYVKVFRMADLLPIQLETEVLAISRCLKIQYGQANILVVNFGSKSMDLMILKEGNLVLVRSFPTSGEAISRVISSSLSLDLPVAEEYKKTYGLSNQVEGKISSIIEPIITNVLNELKKATRFYEERYSDNLKLLILTGGSSLMPGLAEFLAKSINIEVQVADPFSFLLTDSRLDQSFRINSPLFTVALGLAMKGI